MLSGAKVVALVMHEWMDGRRDRWMNEGTDGQTDE